jgi:hypothetical protein
MAYYLTRGHNEIITKLLCTGLNKLVVVLQSSNGIRHEWDPQAPLDHCSPLARGPVICVRSSTRVFVTLLCSSLGFKKASLICTI